MGPGDRARSRPSARSIAVDLPGFGESPALLDATVTPADLAAAVHAHLAGLGLDRPHVAGNSLGGWVALELALAGHARSVTAIAPAGMWAQPLAPKRSTARTIARGAEPGRCRCCCAASAAAAPRSAGRSRTPSGSRSTRRWQLVRAYADAPGFDAVNAGMRAGRFAGLERDRTSRSRSPGAEHDRLVGRPALRPRCRA